ncbi:glycosyltransferase [Allochromatium vinosum]|uniref:glycosyltransferase n=1 Tax=Allochromatium vinosum TaxID=1049 RepID=UPI00167F77CE|nr:glycosyltransferase [Allochromatium vinosum]
MERTACNVANFLASNSHDVFLFYERLGAGEPAYSVLPSVTLMGYDRSRSWDFIKDYILSISPDVCIVFSASSDVIKLTSYLYDTGIPVVMHEGSNPQRIIDNNWSKPRKVSLDVASHERNCILSAASIIRFTLPDYINSIPAVLRSQAVSFPNAFKLAPECDTSQERYKRNKLINIGGLKRNKNLHLLLDALSQIKCSISFDLSIYGPSFDKSYEQEIREKINSSGLANKVYLFPEVRNIEEKYQESSLHIITSEEEGFSSSVVEAMCAGVSSIGLSTCNGVYQLIEDNKNGMLVKSTSNVKRVLELAEIIEKSLKDSDFVRNLGLNALDSAKKFDPKLVYPRWAELVASAQKYAQNDMLFNQQCEVHKSDAIRFRDGLRKLYIDTGLIDKKFYTFLEASEGKLSRKIPGNKHKYDIAIIGAGDLGKIGGIEVSYKHLFKGLFEHGLKVKFFGYKSQNKDFNPDADLNWVPPTFDLEFFDRGQSLEHFRLIKGMIARDNPKLVVIVHSSRIAQFFAAACFDLGIPYIFSMRGSSEYCLRYIWPCLKSLLSTAELSVRTHVLMPSYADLFTLNGVKNITVIPSPVPDGKFAVNQKLSRDDGTFRGCLKTKKLIFMYIFWKIWQGSRVN